jgi:hypothetical protein
MRAARRRRPGRQEGGQAVVETILVTFGLMMLLAIMVQVFLIDQHAYRLATKAHSRLFTQVAYPDNRPDTKYETRWTQKFEGPDEYVPIIGYFRMFGLTRDEMRIRTTHGRPGGYKRIKLGRGTKPDAETGAQDYVDVGTLKQMIATGIEQTTIAKIMAQLAM